ncbi:helix-turn-helix domain-containing protein [Streptomyces ferrugineus]|uniref:Helix-turn-helix domain-containing protein n=1 Tax=Streptomyces ferrugineus TaxID=1413221 RepID=A0A7M2SYV5_9ACTN|nr:helix-turn-helix domain-containing protein [Streptomyces ferrugineus]QOV41557.1 helix-turn-helix domain-containing protein [Streptomyces ferrugineus]
MPRLYRPEEIAETLGCSAWWVKDRARRRLIPHTRVGRAYRFTADHLAEIIRIHEAPAPQRAQRILPPANPPESTTPSRATPQARPSASSAPRLRARPPRRSQYGTAA